MSYPFHLEKKGDGKGNTLLLIAGIQGDEPGGYLAASMILRHYEIKNGSVWIVPNLNFRSIIKNARGDFGDMNRKFKEVSKNDPDYENVQNIKKVITQDEVDIIVHLHDGSGFYREKSENKLKNPARWGQACIIDQEMIDSKQFSNLKEIAQGTADNINKKLLDKEHFYRVKNTDTAKGDKEMEKALTYFALNQKKPAFANEASKELDPNTRVYYHLLAIENYMRVAKIEFKRNFDLSVANIDKKLNSNLLLSFNDNKISFDLSKVRKNINYLPLPRDKSIHYETNNPLLTIVKNGKRLDVQYGSKQLAHIYPEYFEYDDSLKEFEMMIDGKKTKVKPGTKVSVKSTFKVVPKDGYRVNVIGFTAKGRDSEDDIEIGKKSIPARFSLDNDGNVYRLEIYKGDKFSGMVFVNFKETSAVMESATIAKTDKNYGQTLF